MTRIHTDFVSVEIRQIRVIRVPRRGKSAFIRTHLRFLFKMQSLENIRFPEILSFLQPTIANRRRGGIALWSLRILRSAGNAEICKRLICGGLSPNSRKRSLIFSSIFYSIQNLFRFSSSHFRSDILYDFPIFSL